MRLAGSDGVILDAEFDVGEVSRSGRVTLTIESAGGVSSSRTRNPDYPLLLEELLRRLGSLDATLVDALVASRRTASLPVEERRITVRDHSFPVRLRSVEDFADLRLGLTRPQADIGSSRAAGGGNRRKRIELVVDLATPGPRAALIGALSGKTRALQASLPSVGRGVSRVDVEAALSLLHDIGRDEFLEAFGGPGSRFVFVNPDGDDVDALALLVAAREVADLRGSGPWLADRSNVVDPLRALGFAVDDPEAPYEGPLGDEPSQYEDLAERLGGPTDVAVARLGRREQRYLRGALGIGSKDPGATAQCALCAKTLPQSLLVAAHIKPRHRCSDEERLDMPAIGMPLCLLGCDALFERGIVTVGDDGQILALEAPGATTPDLSTLLGELVGLSVSPRSRSQERYLKWHREFHTSRRQTTTR